jgi:uncharacterized protein
MLAVSNTSPISNLASIGRLALLRLQFPVLWIPSAVEGELMAHPNADALSAIQQALREQWIRTAAPPSSSLLGILKSSLHPGEAEAIALATDLRADIVVIDECEARQLATQAGLSVTGVLGILLRAKRAGQISAIAPEIRALRDKARFFIAPSLESAVLVAAGE